MTYRLLFLTIQVHLILLSYGQHKTNLRIEVDSVALNNVVIDYNDGINLHILNDSLVKKALFNLPLNGLYGLLSIQTDNGEYSSFWVNSEPALLKITLDKTGVKVLQKKNLHDPFDPTTNNIHAEYRIAIKAEATKLNRLYTTHGYAKVNQNDSLSAVQNELLKKIDSCKMSVLEKHADTYYSFFMAKNMLEAAIKLNPDPNYLKELRLFMTETYPSTFMASPEGKYLLETTDYKINALAKQNYIQKWLFTDEEGNKFKLHDIQSEYILIDFWATWCVPCMEQLPELDKLSKDYPNSKLQVIGINVDRNYSNFKEVASDLSKYWIHIFDDQAKIRRFLDVHSFPTVLLLDKDRNIVVRSTGGIAKAKLLELIN